MESSSVIVASDIRVSYPFVLFFCLEHLQLTICKVPSNNCLGDQVRSDDGPSKPLTGLALFKPNLLSLNGLVSFQT